MVGEVSVVAKPNVISRKQNYVVTILSLRSQNDFKIHNKIKIIAKIWNIFAIKLWCEYQKENVLIKQ